jgi:hypothetical protein
MAILWEKLTSLPFSNRIDVEKMMAESEAGPDVSDLMRPNKFQVHLP